MRLLRAFLFNTSFALNALLLFLLAFRDRLVVPSWLQVLGRAHPLMLHIPIGLLVLSVLMMIFRKGFKKKSYHNFRNFVLYFLALSASSSAILGILLSREPGYDSLTVVQHMMGGVAVSLLSLVLLGVSLYMEAGDRMVNFLTGINMVVLLITGHLGAVITHGDNFLFAPITPTPQAREITDSTSLYAAAVMPILENRCATCHNPRKAKGKLVIPLDAVATAVGKNGPLFVPGQALHSHLIERITLPENHDDHMPPAGKPQLSDIERRLLFQWIQRGADTHTAWTRFDPTDSLSILARQLIPAVAHAGPAIHYDFAFASATDIQSLNTPFCTVAPLAENEPALFADFFLRSAFVPGQLEALLKVAPQLVQLNLAKMPVTDDAAPTLSKLRELRTLNLNNTSITAKSIAALRQLPHLESISLCGTGVNSEAVAQLATNKSVKRVFVWNTAVTETAVITLKSKYPAVDWETGKQPTDVLRLTAPLLVNDDVFLEGAEQVALRNSLPGVTIRFTLDGTDPDSLRGQVYSSPLTVDSQALIKARASKSGWYASPVAEFQIFHSGLVPSSAELETVPGKDYRGEGIHTLLNNKKGTSDSFRDISWLGYREGPLRAKFIVEGASSVTVSYGVNAGAYILPPERIEIWQGKTPQDLTLRKVAHPQQPISSNQSVPKVIEIPLVPGIGSYFRVALWPVSRVPSWVTKKNEKAWIFTDEVIFR